MSPEARLAILRETVAAGVAGADGTQLLQGFAERLRAAGFPLWRAFVTVESLHPVLVARSFAWSRPTGGAWSEEHRRDGADASDDGWEQSPLFALVQSPEASLRLRLTPGAPGLAFPILAHLHERGATDYVAFKASFGDAGAGDGVLSSWATDRSGGFTATEIDVLNELRPALELAVKSTCLSWTARSLLATYLGADAAERVLAGAVARGVAHTLEAVLWSSDLQGFTRLSDREPRERMIDLLNAYAEAIVDAIEAEGGQVLKLIGDGILATFDVTRLPDAPARALRAAEAALVATARLGDARAAGGLPVSRLRIALHRGEVVYGNVGSPRRLDFTVVGPAVNEATRLCDMCRSLEQEVVVSAAFHAAAPELHGRLVGLGRYALRGVDRPQALFAVERHP